MLDEIPPPRKLTLPPPYTEHWLPLGDAFEEAQRRAEQEGAGCLIWHYSSGGDGPGRLDFAVVLEPETLVDDAQKAVIIGMVALAEAVAAHCPPERDVRFDWPTELVLDAGRLGGMRLAVAPRTNKGDVPDWMVLGVELIADRNHLSDAGEYPNSVSLEEEEFSDPLAIVESFAAYLMLNFDRWTHSGFASVAALYAGRLTTDGALSEAGELVRDGQVTSLREGLAQVGWRGAEGPDL